MKWIGLWLAVVIVAAAYAVGMLCYAIEHVMEPFVPDDGYPPLPKRLPPPPPPPTGPDTGTEVKG